MSFANIFTHSVDCLFILLVLLFGVWKLLSLIRSHLFIFAFVSFAWGDRFPKKYCYNFHQRNYTQVFFTSQQNKIFSFVTWQQENVYIASIAALDLLVWLIILVRALQDNSFLGTGVAQPNAILT